MPTDITPLGQENVLLTPPQQTLSGKKFSRRKILALAGGGTLVLVGGGGVWRASDQGVFSTGGGAAYEPWDNWRLSAKGPLNLVRAAILAANPHNSQPWIFHVTQTQITLFADQQRNIGSVDPFLREMYIGLGCALENLHLAAAANGYTPEIILMPDASNDAFVAQITLTAGNPPVSDLYSMIPQRHTNRYPYDTKRPVNSTSLAALSALNNDPDVRVFWFTSADQRLRISNLFNEATQAAVADKTQNGDTARWWRGTWQDIQQYHDGITIDAAGLPDLTRAIAKMLPPTSQEQQDATFIQNTATQVTTAGALGLLTVRDVQDKKQILGAGRLWERMHLWATKEGLAMQPLNQVVERAAREVVLGSTPHFGTALAALVDDASRQTVLAFRIGYATHEGLRSPKRAVNEVVKS